MSEYVDRKKFENVLKIADSIAKANGKDKDRQIWARAIRLLNDMPTVDAAPVVRCKDCKYIVNATVNSNGFLICHVNDMEIAPDDFCSYGERKEGADNG